MRDTQRSAGLLRRTGVQSWSVLTRPGLLVQRLQELRSAASRDIKKGEHAMHGVYRVVIHPAYLPLA